MKIAIVTVTFNDKDNLKRTFESIRRYKKNYHKYFVIDGNSNDGTLEELEENSNILDDYIAEEDEGIYDAMNKAIRFEIDDEDYILWLNAGDELLDWEGININELKEYDCAFYSVLTKMDVTDNFFLRTPLIKLPYDVKNFYPNSRYMHQGFLIKKCKFEKLRYNTEIGLQAENLLMSLCILNYSFLVSIQPISVFYLDGVSNRQLKEVRKSYLKVAEILGFSKKNVIYYHKMATFKYYVRRFLPLKWSLIYSKFIRKRKFKQ